MTTETERKAPADPNEFASNIHDPVFWFAQFSSAVERNRLDDAAQAVAQLNRLRMTISWDEEQTAWAIKPI